MSNSPEYEKKINEIYGRFKVCLEKYDKPGCARLIQGQLESGDISIEDIYTKVLQPSLAQIASNYSQQEIDIWDEHLRSSIVRTMVEICFPYVIEKIQPVEEGAVRKTAIVACLDDEQHDIGARMVSDILLLKGYESYFIGANTDKEQMLKAIISLDADYCAISVSNYYHLTGLQETIEYLKENTDGACKIMVGGYAINNTPGIRSKITPDYFVEKFEDLDDLGGNR